MRVAVACGVALFVALVLLFTIINSHELTSEELIRRCILSDPAWNGYQEDIKEIGARPVAQWHGEPVALEVLQDGVRLTMRLEAPWDGWEAALPVLLKDPEEHVHRDVRSERDGNLRIYHFSAIPGAGTSAPPWLEIQYPHTKRRIHLDPSGHWQANGAQLQ